MQLRIVVLYFFIFSSINLHGQERPFDNRSQSERETFIKWTGSLPNASSKENIGFFEKIINFITGYEPVVFNNPVSVSVKNSNSYLVVNQGNGNILDYHENETSILPVFKKEENYYPSLVGLCSFGNEGFLLTDSKLNKVFLISPDGRKIAPFGDAVNLNRPTGIAFSSVKNEVWVVETGAHRISVFNRSGKLIRTIGERGNDKLQFNFPAYIWIDNSGKIYIVDSMNFRVQVLSAEGNFITMFGRQGDATGSFARPRGIATDSQGNIYVVDALFNAVQIFNMKGELLYYFGSQGSEKYQFRLPSGIFIDNEDNIYVSDSYNGRIQMFKLLKK
jgi:DNA-binding beta-propeller fold protein YncE